MNKKSAVFVVVLTILVTVTGAGIYKEWKHNSEVLAGYKAAEQFITNGDYADALEILNGLKADDYHDTEELIDLCNAHISYEAGDVVAAHRSLYYLKFSYLTAEQQEEVDMFSDEVERAYEEYMEQERIAEQKAYEEKVRSGVPFVGMLEIYIADTSLGSPSSDVRHNYECINGEQYRANLYDFKEGGNTIFTVRCVQGKVIQVWDHRDNPVKPYKSSSSGSRKSKKEDVYDVYDYSDPEDFYYDNYDDFDGYEDAEDYWNDAWE